MSGHFDEFLSGPRAARQNRTRGTTGRSHTRAVKTQYLNFDGFFTGPRAAR